jgi:hypothetical protein
MQAISIVMVEDAHILSKPLVDRFLKKGGHLSQREVDL